ncbi:site-specific integrase [Castellaniella sp. MT123]|uniref:site-specific integrase n=1 Tax=Castellaniella sp. MT123 TaxID=3140381 RepID=UPI0031F35E93
MAIVDTGASPRYIITSERSPGRPRFWATAWVVMTAGKGWAANTLITRLRHIDNFYRHCDTKFGIDSLDSALGESNAARVHRMADDFYVGLTSNTKYTTTDVQSWDAVRGFVLYFARYWAIKDDSWRAVIGALKGTGRIRPPKRGCIKFARSLPDRTLTDLLAIAQPASIRNPIKSRAIQIRNWLILLLMLLCGLRRSEVLLLTVDSLKHDIEPKTGELQYWLDVTTTEDNTINDSRATRPSMKTANAHRQVPISYELASLVENYVADFRGDVAQHNFLLTSSTSKPLSAESVNKMLVDFSERLEPQALQRFRERTGGKQHISPHDLRHTCATVRYALFIATDSNRELAFQRMRAFFGWAIESDEPALYARAAIHDDLLKSWNDLFDKKVELLRQGIE